MNNRDSARQSLWFRKIASASNPFRNLKLLSAVLLAILLIVNALPAGARSTANAPARAGELQTASTVSAVAEADASVEERNPTTNYGTAGVLDVVTATNRSIESYLRFTVSGTSGTIQSARLRVYSTTDGTKNGPAIYATSSTWTETGITWSNRPARTSSALGNKGSIAKNTWVEYDVTSLVTGNGTYSFVLAGDSNDNVQFSSREGSNPPQLVITFNTSTPTATRTPTRTPTAVSSATSTPTATAGSGSALTFITEADAQVSESSPNTNYGTATTILVDGGSGTSQNGYFRFTVSGISGSIQSVKLRVYCTSNGTANGPAAYLANSSWTESGITWNTQPALLSGAFDNKGSISASTWVEYNVTPLVTGNGTYTFALVADSTDGVVFYSREGANHPQLVITLGTAAATATRTPTSAVNPTQTATRTPTPVSNPTQTRTPTPTATSSSGSVVLVGAGDISSCSNNNDEATAKLLDGISGTVFNAGDNAYDSGTLTEYTNCYDPTWGRHKARTKPVPGNHEYQTSGASGYFQYFNNPPAYYAYNLGGWRIYALNSEIDVSASGAQATWLQSDLNANPTQCVLAYWHKPRWSSGSTHGSTSSMQTLWQILYNAGAEIVVNGHEHNYERFAEMNASGAKASPGLREFVVGTGGIGHYGFGAALASSEVRDSTSFGVLKLTLRAGGYDWQFVPVAGATFTDSGSGTCH